jgi:hypothetical protein
MQIFQEEHQWTGLNLRQESIGLCIKQMLLLRLGFKRYCRWAKPGDMIPMHPKCFLSKFPEYSFEHFIQMMLDVKLEQA